MTTIRGGSITAGFAAQRRRVLALLQQRQGQGATTTEISSPAVGGNEGPRRLRELRDEGWPILARQMANGLWRYWLQQPGETVLKQPSLWGDDE